MNKWVKSYKWMMCFSLTSFLASVASAGVPSGGLVTTWVLGIIGLPTSDVELIVSIDWLM